MLNNAFKVYLYRKNIFWYVKGTQFSSPEIIHFKVKGLRGDYQNSDENSAFKSLQTMQVWCSLL